MLRLINEEFHLFQNTVPHLYSLQVVVSDYHRLDLGKLHVTLPLLLNELVPFLNVEAHFSIERIHYLLTLALL